MKLIFIQRLFLAAVQLNRATDLQIPTMFSEVNRDSIECKQIFYLINKIGI